MRIRLAVLTFVAMTMHAGGAAAEWTERRFDPGVGSRWTVLSEVATDETRRGRTFGVEYRAAGELAFVARTADGGFEVSKVMNKFEVLGDSPIVPILRDAVPVLYGVPIRAITDANGLPVRILNVEALRTAVGKFADRVSRAMRAHPQFAAALRHILQAALPDDGPDKAHAVFEDLPLLAIGHNTGLAPGGTRRKAEAWPVAAGAEPLASFAELRLTRADAATGKAKMVQVRTFDTETLKRRSAELVQSIIVPADFQPPLGQRDAIMAGMAFDIANKTELEVEGGITRIARDQTTISGSVMNQPFTRKEWRAVGITPAK